jgi:hypothetical protein
MRSKTISILTALTLATIFLSACTAIARHHDALIGHDPASRLTAVEDNTDPISGEWNVTFFVHDSKTPATFTLKREGTTITGTAYSDHTGAGTIRDGKWMDGKLSFTLDFKKHESIAITAGELKQGKLAGQFSTEGFTEKWEATKK